MNPVMGHTALVSPLLRSIWTGQILIITTRLRGHLASSQVSVSPWLLSLSPVGYRLIVKLPSGVEYTVPAAAPGSSRVISGRTRTDWRQ